MQWTYEGKEIDNIPNEYEGFVYLITNTTTNQKYIGKKLAKFKTTKPPLKGKKNKRRGTKESDWREYYGSSDRLNADVAALGADKFTREILEVVNDSNKLNEREQYYLDLYECAKSDMYYNISPVSGGGNLGHDYSKSSAKAKQTMNAYFDLHET